MYSKILDPNGDHLQGHRLADACIVNYRASNVLHIQATRKPTANYEDGRRGQYSNLQSPLCLSSVLPLSYAPANRLTYFYEILTKTSAQTLTVTCRLATALPCPKVRPERSEARSGYPIPSSGSCSYVYLTAIFRWRAWSLCS